MVTLPGMNGADNQELMIAGRVRLGNLVAMYYDTATCNRLEAIPLVKEPGLTAAFQINGVNRSNAPKFHVIGRYRNGIWKNSTMMLH